MSSVDSSNQPTQHKRGRPPKSCERCREQKIKCDRKRPCDQCLRSKCNLSCTYASDNNNNNNHPVKIRRVAESALSQNIQIITPPGTNPTSASSPGRARRSLRGYVIDTPTINADSTAPDTPTWAFRRFSIPVAGNSMTLMEGQHRKGREGNSDAASGLEGPSHSTSTIQSLLERVRVLEQKLSETASNPRSSHPATEGSMLSAQNDDSDPERANGKRDYNADTELPVRGTFSKTRLFGQSHWMNSVEQFDKLYSIYRRAVSDENSELGSLFKKCKRLGKTIKTLPSTHQPAPPDVRDYVLPRQQTDQLVGLYLRTFEYVYRVLHIPTFQQEYTRFWHNPQSASTEFVMKLLLVMAIGSVFYKESSNSTSLRPFAIQWIHAAQSWLISPFEKSRMNITGLQVQCLLLLARQANAINGDLVWISAGSLLRTAMYMGFHHDPAHLPRMSFFQQEMRRRLWATVLEIVLQSSMDSGGPPLISCHDFNCESPSNLDDDQLDEAGNSPPIAKPTDIFTQTSVQVALMKSFSIRLKIATLLNGSRTSLSYDETLRLGAELTSFCRSNSRLFQSFPKGRPQPTTFHIRVLDILTHRFLIALHQPFAIKAKTNPTYYFSRKVCLECSLFLLDERLEYSMFQLDERFQTRDYHHLELLGAGLFRNIPLQAIIIICSEIFSQIQEDDSQPYTAVSNSPSRRGLEGILRDYKQLLLSRIESGETNVKGYVMFSALLAHIKAMQEGGSVEQEMHNAMVESLELCCGLLRERVERDSPQQTDGENSDGQQQDTEYDGDEDWFGSSSGFWFGWDGLMQDSTLNFDMIPDSSLFRNLMSTDNNIP